MNIVRRIRHSWSKKIQLPITMRRIVLSRFIKSIRRGRQWRPTKQNQRQTMDLFPIEITTNILARLPVRWVFVCRSVCKTWRCLIDNPQFAQMHLSNCSVSEMDNKAYPSSFVLLPESIGDYKGVVNILEDYSTPESPNFRFSKVNIPFPDGDDYVNPLINVGFSNGFFCLSSCDIFSNPFLAYVCNPATREFVRLPDFPRFEITAPCTPIDWMKSGFGWVPSSKEFKLVHIVGVENRNHHVEYKVYIYTLGSKSWRMAGQAPDNYFPNLVSILTTSDGKSWTMKGYFYGLSNPSESQEIIVPAGPLVLVNASLHSITYSYTDNIGFQISIFSFDLEDDRFGIVSSPNCRFLSRSCNNTHYFQLGALGGCLSLLDCTVDDHYDMWVMKDYNVSESWSKQFVIKTEPFVIERVMIIETHIFEPLCLRKNGELLLLAGRSILVSYNLESRKSTLIKDVKHLEWDYKCHTFGSMASAFPYTGNLLSPKDEERNSNGKKNIGCIHVITNADRADFQG